ncbi:MAG: hypothetical protein HYU69_01525 [Bacteroidetes bacterium]|nr:hypothetical protein [Bacteroidota bacterium]
MPNTLTIERGTLSSGQGMNVHPHFKKNEGQLTGNGWIVIDDPYCEEEVDTTNANQPLWAYTSPKLDFKDKPKDEDTELAKQYEKIRIQYLFMQELRKYINYVQDILTDTISKTDMAIDKIASLSYQAISLELTPDKSIIFHLKYSEGKELLIELYYVPKAGKTKEAFFALYENKKCLFNGMGKLDEVISDIKTIIEDKK